MVNHVIYLYYFDFVIMCNGKLNDELWLHVGAKIET